MKKSYNSENRLIRFYESQKIKEDFSFFSVKDFIKIIDYYFSREKTEDAIEAGTIANKEHPYNLEVILFLAKLQNTLRKYEEALELLENSIFIFPNNPDIHYWMGKIYDELAESESAIDHFDLALENCTTNKDEIYIGKSLVFIHDEKFDKARIFIYKALKLNPYNQTAISELIDICSTENEKSVTLKFFEKIIDGNPYDHKIWNNFGLLLDSFELHEKAIEVLELSVSIKDNDPETYYLLGNAYLNIDNYENATKAFRRAIEFGKNEYNTWSQLGLSYTFLEDYNSAQECFLTSVEQKPNFAQGWFGLGIVSQNLKNNKLAIHYIKKAISLNPSNERFYYELAFSYANEVMLTEAEETFKQAVELNPFFVDGWIDYSLFLYEQIKFSEAVNALQEAMTFNPDEAELYFVISGLLYDQGLGNRGKFYS